MMVALDAWVFQHRKQLVATSAIPVLALFTVEDHLWLEHWPEHNLVHVLGWSLLAIGILIRLWATLHIGGNKSRHLVSGGPYSLTRNPLYFGSFVSLIGILVLTESIVAASLCFFVLTWIYRRTILHEERKLETLFGEDYRRYCGKVPRFFPRFGAFRSMVNKDVFHISYRDIGREASTVLGFISAAFCALAFEDTLEYLHEVHRLPVWIPF